MSVRADVVGAASSASFGASPAATSRSGRLICRNICSDGLRSPTTIHKNRLNPTAPSKSLFTPSLRETVPILRLKYSSTFLVHVIPRESTSPNKGSQAIWKFRKLCNSVRK